MTTITSPRCATCGRISAPNCLTRKNFNLLPLPELRREVLENGQRKTSQYDVIAINMPWLGQAVNAASPALTRFLESSGINPLDFHPTSGQRGRGNKTQYGVPIYCTVETLVAPQGPLRNAGPGLSHQLRQGHRGGPCCSPAEEGPERHRWNAAPGMPVAHSFMFFMGCCGRAVINLPTTRLYLDYSKLNGRSSCGGVNSEQGRRTLDFMHRLLSISPPDIMNIDWNKALEYFMTAMRHAYCWTMRAPASNTTSVPAFKRKVEYLPHPHGPGGYSVSPIGGFPADGADSAGRRSAPSSPSMRSPGWRHPRP